MRKQLLTVAAAAGIMLSGIHGTASANEYSYTVKQGDTLWKISNANQLTVKELVDWNKLSTTEIRVGQSLSLADPSVSTKSTYTVKPSDTLWIIATSNGLTLTELKSLNGLTSDIIYPGQSLVVKGSPTSPSYTNASINTYTVKSGDSLWVIASRHNLSVAQLKMHNQLSSDNIYVGQVLKLTSNEVQTVLPASQASLSKVEALITEAKKYIGVPYKWGGSTPTAFDCSGYLNYVYNRVGISIPRTVTTIWNTTKSVSSPNIGDIVFFNTSGSGPSHAGIYLGNNQFIHSGTSTGVTISDLNQSYWKTKYLGARSPF